MEEDTIELVGYLRVIWKRKRLILVGTLVCIIAVGVISLRLPEIYRAEVLISIGKKLSSVFPSSSVAAFDTPKNLTKSIPAEYGLNDDEEALKYPLKAEEVRGTPLIKVIQEGPDRKKVEEFLKGVVNRLIDDHLRKTETSLQPYRVFIGKLETDIKMIQKDIAQLEVQLEKMNIEKTDPVAVAMIQNNLWQRGTNLRDTQQDLLFHRSIVDRLKKYQTKMVGGVKTPHSPVRPNKERNVMIASVVGLMMSLFLAFFIEYVGKVRESEKEKAEDSV